MSLFLSELLNAISLAALYFLIALGITLVFGLTRIVNFAQGQLVLLGAFVGYACSQVHVPVIACVVLAMIVVGIAGEVLDLGVFRRTLDVPLNGFVASLGLIIALQAAFALVWPGTYYVLPAIATGSQRVGSVGLSNERLIFVATAAVTFVGALLFVGRTHWGRGIRALAEDRAGAQALGVSVGPLTSLAFTAGSALAGAAGALLGTVTPFNAVSGSEYLIIGFAVAVVGGFGSIAGTAVASLLLGAAFAFGAAYVSPAWSYGILLGAMAIMIVLRPRGLIGARIAGSDDPMERHQHLVEDETELLSLQWQRWARYVPGALFLAAVVATGLLPLYIGSAGNLSLATAGIVNAIAAYSVWLPFRLGGMLSLAQAALVGVGAYTTAYLAVHGIDTFWAQVPAAMSLSALGAAIIGLIALRTSGSYFVVLVMALAELLVVLMKNLTQFTGGTLGTVLAAPPKIFGSAFDLADLNHTYWLTFASLVLVIGALAVVSRRRFGALLTGLRDNAVLAVSLGLRIQRYRLGALCCAGAIAGLAGALTAYVNLGIDPTYFSNSVGIQLILMVIIGGATSLAGPLIGAMVVTFLPIVFPLSPYQSQLVYGLLLVLIILVAPEGIAGLGRSFLIVALGRLRRLPADPEQPALLDSPSRRPAAAAADYAEEM